MILILWVLVIGVILNLIYKKIGISNLDKKVEKKMKSWIEKEWEKYK